MSFRQANYLKDSKITLNDKWKEISFEFELYKEDLGIGLWDEWILCFQNYKPLNGFEALELKNVKISASGEENTAAQTEAPVTKAPLLFGIIRAQTNTAPKKQSHRILQIRAVSLRIFLTTSLMKRTGWHL